MPSYNAIDLTVDDDFVIIIEENVDNLLLVMASVRKLAIDHKILAKR